MQSSKKKKNSSIIEIPEKMPIHTAFQNRVRSVQFNVIFPDGKGGAVTISKVSKEEWQPSEDIDHIEIIWKE